MKVVAQSAAAARDGTPQVSLTIVPTNIPLATSAVGENLALHFRLGGSGRAQLVVPVSAVVTSAAGTSSVTVLRGGRQVAIPVKVSIAVNGEAAIESGGRSLHAGDEVVVGPNG